MLPALRLSPPFARRNSLDSAGLLLRLIFTLMALVLGGYLLFLAADPVRFQLHMQFLLQEGGTPMGRVVLASIGGLCLAVVPAQLLVWAVSRRYAKTLKYRVAGDKVTVSLQAVEEALSRALENDPAVRTATVRVLANRWRRRVDVEAALVLYEDSDLSVVDGRCPQLLRARFKEVMSGVKRVSFSLHIDRLRSRASDPGHARLATVAEDSSERLMGMRQTPAIPLPGLTATGGATSKEAAAALLANGDSAEPAEVPSQSITAAEPVYDDEPIPSSAHTPADGLVPAGDSEEKAVKQGDSRPVDAVSDLQENLYAGPSYPVGDADEEDES